ncbi:MAG: guanitoxin biosynthesis heme-dependent pre-guanitoxin N-hydroxylase GntA [Thermoanaerobaculia bacterium]
MAHSEPWNPVAAFEALIELESYPCVGAKSAHARRDITYLLAGSLTSPRSDAEITRALQTFAADRGDRTVFTSLVVLFPDSPRLSEAQFEVSLWARLQAIHDIDAPDHIWDPSVSSDPASPAFSMSVGGRAFYVVGMHPQASRLARRFDCPTLIWNLHSQFEQLRQNGRYEKLRAVIASRDVAFSGSRNPMLSDHGATSEAPQYSGRLVGEEWRCPFHATDPPKP